MQKISILVLLFIAAGTCAAKPTEKQELPAGIHDGIRGECKEPPSPPKGSEALGCMWNEVSDLACCAFAQSFTAADGGLWGCVEYVCQPTCSAHWRPVERKCQLIGQEKERPAAAKKVPL